RLRVAGLLRAGRRGGGRGGERPELRHGPHGGALRELRRTSRTRVPGRAAADRAALLHQLGRAEARRALTTAECASTSAGSRCISDRYRRPNGELRFGGSSSSRVRSRSSSGGGASSPSASTASTSSV